MKNNTGVYGYRDQKKYEEENINKVKKYGYTTNNFFKNNNNKAEPDSNLRSPHSQNKYKKDQYELLNNINQFEEKNLNQIVANDTNIHNTTNNLVKKIQYNNAMDLVI